MTGPVATRSLLDLIVDEIADASERCLIFDVWDESDPCPPEGLERPEVTG